jgi:hypothetical protein
VIFALGDEMEDAEWQGILEALSPALGALRDVVIPSYQVRHIGTLNPHAQVVGTVDELCSKLEAIDRESDAAVRLSEEWDEHARAAQRNLAGNILLLFPSDCRFLRCGMFDFPS